MTVLTASTAMTAAVINRQLAISNQQLAATALALLLSCSGEHRKSAGAHVGWNPGPTPLEWHHGEVLFNTYCLSCHGRHGTGEGLGPPLLDTLYRAGKLSDESIYTAVAQGVRQHHWYYGAMPPVARMSRDETREVIGYLRWVQERAGLNDAMSPTPDVK